MPLASLSVDEWGRTPLAPVGTYRVPLSQKGEILMLQIEDEDFAPFLG